MSTAPVPTVRDRRGRVYTPAVGPKLKRLLIVIFCGVALLGANSVYLASISALEWLRGDNLQTPFYLLMFGLHLIMGLGLLLPFVAFAGTHLVTAWKRPNKGAVRYGLALLTASILIIVTGLILVRVEGFELKDPTVRRVGYWLHVLAPVVAIGLYVLHRLAGPRIQWGYAKVWAGSVAVFVLAMGLLHSHDPRSYAVRGPKEGRQYFFPSEAVTATGQFIPASTLMMDDYCMKCHKDAYDGWFHSAHHFSSFNNKAYLTSVRETRKVSMEQDGNTKRARWCAGCHDPVPFFSGEFDDPNYDDVNNPTSQAGITCTSCHAITDVHSTRGNGDYTIDTPQHYPFAQSKEPILQWINQALVKAKPEMHKKTFLKPLHKDSAFCSTCHKVGLPWALNHYKDFLRGQNHYDTYLLSGVSGHGARSFYYPPEAKGKCADCHMNLLASNDFGARDFDNKGGLKIHNHLFLGANTGLPVILGVPEKAKPHADYLKDKKVRIDLFALREGGEIDGAFLGPLRPEVPTIKPGSAYLVETVVRTLGLGHPLTQGTVDSNEIWVELIARAGDKIIGRSGGIGPDGQVDPYSHFINVYMLDKDGKRIDRRNPQDIFIPLYNKQIPPGAGQVVHFRLEVPQGLTGPITLEAKVNYRKFDRTYMDYVYGKGQGPTLPVVEMAADKIQLPIAGGPTVTNPPSPIAETWQRWNDYGIGLLLEGEEMGANKGELKQAEVVFKKVAELGRADGWVNLARVYLREGRTPDAREALDKATNHKEPAAPWVIAWLNARTNEVNGYLDEAIRDYRSVLNTKVPARGFDFSMDYEIINALATTLYGRARQESIGAPERETFLRESIEAYRRTLALDSENVAAHYGLGLAYGDPTWGDPVPHNSPEASPVTPEVLENLAMQVDTPGVPASDRAFAASRLDRSIAAFLESPRPASGSRLNPLHELVERLGPAWEKETDPAARTSLARTLSHLHQTMHRMFKPDETAIGRAVKLARERDPAANLNAESIVIHPLHRPGAPGLDPAAEKGHVAARESVK